MRPHLWVVCGAGAHAVRDPSVSGSPVPHLALRRHSRRWFSKHGPSAVLLTGPVGRKPLEHGVPVPRLQKIIHRNDGAEETCTERDGWCLPKTSDDLRNAMSLLIRQTIRAQRPGEGESKGGGAGPGHRHGDRASVPNGPHLEDCPEVAPLVPDTGGREAM